LQQQGFRIAVLGGQGFLEVEQVGRRFEQRTRQLLQLRVAVHFQRVEIFVADALRLGLDTAENLRLGFRIEAAQLVAHPLDSRFHLAEGEAEVAHLLLDTATENRGFPRQVDQAFEQLRGYLDQLLRRTTGQGFLGCLAGLLDKGQHLGSLARGQRGTASGDNRLGKLAAQRLGGHLGNRHWRLALLVQTRAQLLQFALQTFVGRLQVDLQAFRPRLTLPASLRQMLLQIMTDITQTLLPGQPRTALEGVQQPQQIVQCLAILGATAHPTDRGLDGLQQVFSFFEEDVEDIAIGFDQRLFFARRLQVHRRGHAQLLVGIGPEALDQFDESLAIRQRAPLTQGFEHLLQTVMAVLQQAEQRRAGTQPAIAQAFVEELQLMSQVANGTDFRHARTPLEGMQVTLQRLQFQAVIGIGHPALQRCTRTFDDVETFLEEDFHQLEILLIHCCRRHGLWLWLSINRRHLIHQLFGTQLRQTVLYRPLAVAQCRHAGIVRQAQLGSRLRGFFRQRQIRQAEFGIRQLSQIHLY